MGEVCRARDTRLNRDVAIKVSAEQFTDRFEREARAIAALNHPNICHLYDVGPDYLVMELVDGPTLAEKLKSGAIPLEESLNIARQIAAALASAHENGITHRDLKPGNVKIKSDGTVKVLDFGLAKIGGTPSMRDDNSPTITMDHTEAGVILGTAAYMSPEQAKGKAVDHRADIYSFGVVLYEVVTGKRLHQGDTTTEVLASVIKEEPQWDKVPVQMRKLLRRCLEKDPQKRLHHIDDVMDLVENVDPAAVQPASKTQFLWPSIALALIVMAGVAAWWLWPKLTGPTRATRFQVTLPEGVEFSQYVSVSPDGHKLVFNATGVQSGLWIHDLNTLEWRKLPGTDGGRSPFWSPDSRFLGFTAGNELKKIDVSGGPPQTLCRPPLPPGSGAWSSDGVIIFGGFPTGPLRRVSAAGGIPTELVSLDASRGESGMGLPTFLPDGKHFLYLLIGSTEVQGMYAGSLDAKPTEQSRTRIMATPIGALYADGNVFFMRDSTLMAQRFDSAKLQLTGEPVPVAEPVGTLRANGFFSVSTNGVLAYRAGAAAGLLQPNWFDREGKLISKAGEPAPDQVLVLSPDSTHAAGRDAGQTGQGDIWLTEFTRGVRTRFTFRRGSGSVPVWSPDGKRIFFSAGGAGYVLDTIYEKSAGGADTEKVLLKTNEAKVPTSVSSDGRFLLYYTSASGDTGSDVWVLPLDGAGKPVRLLGSNFNELRASFSPDGRWFAYLSNESGRYEVYVRPFNPSGPSLGEGQRQISKDGAAGGITPKWRSDGKEIIFGTSMAEASPMAVEVNGKDAALQVDTPNRLFIAQTNDGWDVTADHKRFLMLMHPGAQTAQTPITVVLNWQADLKK
jgi:Tol biopolymer transport system component